LNSDTQRLNPHAIVRAAAVRSGFPCGIPFWQPSEFEFTDAEITRMRAAIETWNISPLPSGRLISGTDSKALSVNLSANGTTVSNSTIVANRSISTGTIPITPGSQLTGCLKSGAGRLDEGTPVVAYQTGWQL
jgi:hypothetical protein